MRPASSQQLHGNAVPATPVSLGGQSQGNISHFQLAWLLGLATLCCQTTSAGPLHYPTVPPWQERTACSCAGESTVQTTAQLRPDLQRAGSPESRASPPMHAALLLKSKLRLAGRCHWPTLSAQAWCCAVLRYSPPAPPQPAIIGFCKGWHHGAHAERAAANESHGYRPAIHVSGTGGEFFSGGAPALAEITAASQPRHAGRGFTGR